MFLPSFQKKIIIEIEDNNAINIIININLIFPPKYTRYGKNVEKQNC